ncbi:hypothetical protein PR048_027914 [Dryococelus australis]|uniref:Uncharacterized protein n=1 Tax=Dryococelus australis TaxID=614101 RepID=A0ABQ9GHT3_9NEOP|nr:hypothetical protein PR048_027914 [Dryococelus australis]
MSLQWGIQMQSSGTETIDYTYLTRQLNWLANFHKDANDQDVIADNNWLTAHKRGTSGAHLLDGPYSHTWYHEVIDQAREAGVHRLPAVSLNMFPLKTQYAKAIEQTTNPDEGIDPNSPLKVISPRDIRNALSIQPSTSARAGTSFLVTGSPHTTPLQYSLEKQQKHEEQAKQPQSKAKKQLKI